MNVMTVILTATITLLICACVFFAVLYFKEKGRRIDAVNDLQHWNHTTDAVLDTQRMVCQSTDSVEKGIEEAQRALYEQMRLGFSEMGGAIEAGFRKLDELSAGGMDAEARRTLEADLNKLLSYSMDDAFKAAKGIGSDGT